MINEGKGFTLIELIVVIAVISIIAGIAVPIYIALVEDAHKGHMDGIEGILRSAVILYASEHFLDHGELLYPEEAIATIKYMTDPGLLNDWTDLGNGIWLYNPTGGTLTYNQNDDGYSFSITKKYKRDL
jgi:prepilin-type N-terminal cleavage/methylation domain-containing protein